MTPIIIIAVAAIVLFVTISALLSRYKRCPSDKILVIFGKRAVPQLDAFTGVVHLFGLLFRVLLSWI